MSSFVDPRDSEAIRRPTRRKPRKGEQEHVPTVEERAWSDEARVLSIMAHGFTYTEAWHMGFRDYRRYSALATAWSIPQEQREEVTFRPTAKDNDAYT